MPPNAPENIGRENVEKWSKAFLDQFHVKFALGVDDVRVSGDWAIEKGSYTISLTPKSGGSPIQDVGKYLTTYHREPGKGWQIAYDIWNSNTPPDAA